MRRTESVPLRGYSAGGPDHFDRCSVSKRPLGKAPHLLWVFGHDVWPTVDWLRLASLPLDGRLQEVQAHIEALDLTESKGVIKPFAELCGHHIFGLAADRVLVHLQEAASPRRAILALQDCFESLETSRGDASALFVEPILDLLIGLCGSSARAARLLTADPALAIELGVMVVPETHAIQEPYESYLTPMVRRTAGDTPAFERALRRYRHHQMLRIALRELKNADLRSTAAEVADLASSTMQAALHHHYPIVVQQHGAPEPPCSHVVMGMGKLGGGELNFSSDIDVIYLYEHDQGGAGELTMHEFHVKLFERVTAAIGAITEHGMVFRVDLDLRPEGARGPLANSLASAERYYETWGRTWERAAWIKARAIAGDPGLGEQVANCMRPFIYRRSFDLEAIKAIVEMKAKIDRNQKKASVSRMARGIDLKLGRGGIREIEFFVQAHQMLYGGREPLLRHQNTLDALSSVEAAGHINSRTREIMSDAYLFFRKVEHRVQIVDEQQTHNLPTNPQDLSYIARSLSFDDGGELIETLQGHMTEVHEIFASLLGHVEDEEGPDADIEQIADPNADRDSRVELLAQMGAHAPQSALANIETAMRLAKSPLHDRATPAKRRAGLAFLAECLASPSVDRALTHLPDLIHRLSIHSSYLSELDRPAVRRGIARVLGSSDLLARILTSSPVLLPQVLLAQNLSTPTALQANLESRLETVGDDVELALITLRVFQQEETLKTALADLAGRLEQHEVAARLTNLAETLIQATLGLARREAVLRFGEPEDDGAGLVVVAGGTLGANEMGYRSDVDLTLIYAGEGETAGGNRRAITLQEFYTRMVQRFVTFLTMRMPQGDLYPVDMRLRPSGSQGPLVATLRNFENYHSKAAHLWERQSLVRTRVIAGDARRSELVQSALHRSTYGAPLGPDSAQLIVDMRHRMAKESPRARGSRGHSLDIKVGRGGLVELEFVVQYLLLKHGQDRHELRTPCTREALAALGESELLNTELARRLVQAHDYFRQVQNWLRLAQDEMVDRIDLRPEQLRPLALAVGYAGEDAQMHMARDLEAHTDLVHETFVTELGVQDEAPTLR